MSISIIWDKEAGVDGYNLYRSPDPMLNGAKINAVMIPQPLTDEVEYIDSTVLNGNVYYYRVTSIVGTSESQFSDSIRVPVGLPMDFTPLQVSIIRIEKRGN